MREMHKRNLNLVYAIAISLGCLIGSPDKAMANDAGIKSDMSFDLDGITVEARRPDWETKLSPGSVSVIHTEDFEGEQKTLSDLLVTVPGVHVREVNGKGQYTTVTVRGSTAAQVGIFIDGVLANLGGDSAVDLSTIPIQNVERIEVYRGYVPSRFGGTFIGGVINIVTKRPTKADVSLEVGKSSFGGRKGSMEITSPLGDGSLMLGVNYESSDGDFKYKNYAAESGISALEHQLNSINKSISDRNSENIKSLVSGGFVNFDDATINNFKNNSDTWLNFVRDTDVNGNGIGKAIYENRFNYFEKALTDNFALIEQQLIDKGIKQDYLDAGYTDGGRNDWKVAAKEDWDGTGSEGIIDTNLKNDLISNYADANYQTEINKASTNLNPETDSQMSDWIEDKEKADKSLKHAKDAERVRKYNDYENGSAILKWQNDNWVVKGTYNKIDRHLPDGVWGGDIYNAVINSAVDIYDMYYWDSRRQEVESTGLMLQNRTTVGDLEIGWMLDYLHKDSNYRAEHLYPPPGSQWEYENTPFREWSEYKSDKYNGQIDGSYKLGEKSMIDFQMNYSHERMDVDGSNLDKVIASGSENKAYAQVRNRYDQEIFNFQLQNSITLDDKGSWVITPAVRYNQSTITGYSNGSRFQEGYFGWIKPKEEQTDSKFTYQMALKKEFNDKFAMRVTGGSYYRLLNMSEIAGDGAGVLPAPSDINGSGSVFPVPEEGKQFDISALVNGKFLGADNRTTLTYFWRESENMLQLVRYGKDYWCYFNDNRGESNGVELQSSLRWNKFDLDVQVTYLNPFMERKNSASKYDYDEIWATYQPEWEGNVRLTYRPSDKFSIFTEAHYKDEYFTNYAKDEAGGEKAYLSGMPVSDLFTINSGMKWQPRKNVQITFGCNDIFNEGPKMKIKTESAFGDGTGNSIVYVNPEFPIQGRTYYVTAKVDF